MIKFESEAKLEDFIIDNITEGLVLEGLRMEFKGNKKKLYQQYTLGDYGRTDLVVVDMQDKEVLGVNIIELKNVPIDASAIFQVSRYVKGFEHLIEDDDRISNEAYVKGFLLGPGYDNKAWHPTFTLLDERVSMSIFELDIKKGLTITPINKEYKHEDNEFKCSLEPIFEF